MMMDEDNKCYLHFYHYLVRRLCDENPEKAKQLAKEVYSDILSNKSSFNNEGILMRFKNIFSPEVE
jgi:uncharacterized protein YozE (UPF0346 family)